MGRILSVTLLLWVLFASAWIVNLVKFTNCDFEADYRCEITHGVGTFLPPTVIVTVWFDDDEKN